MSSNGSGRRPYNPRSMSMRVAALFLILVVLWSGFATRERAVPTAVAGADQAVVLSAGGSVQTLTDGPVSDDCIDLPSQAHAESVPDLPDLLVAPANEPAPELGIARPHPYAASTWLPPYLDGPQRPPRASAVLG
jgi:hypothetical protein